MDGLERMENGLVLGLYDIAFGCSDTRQVGLGFCGASAGSLGAHRR